MLRGWIARGALSETPIALARAAYATAQSLHATGSRIGHRGRRRNPAPDTPSGTTLTAAARGFAPSALARRGDGA